jgi:hypothetical protein
MTAQNFVQIIYHIFVELLYILPVKLTVKKVFSILFILVLLLSGVHLTVAKHFCGGVIAGEKISLSGKLASCGMEGTEATCPVSGRFLKTHCCDNQVSTFGMINIYTAPVTFQSEKSEKISHNLYIPVIESFYSLQGVNIFFTDTGPPGDFSASAVDLFDICVFRI